MIGNRERVGRTLELLHKGLYPFVEREMRAIYSDKWIVAATPFVSQDRTLRRSVEQILKQKPMKLTSKNKNFCGYALQNKLVVKLAALLSNP